MNDFEDQRARFLCVLLLIMGLLIAFVGARGDGKLGVKLANLESQQLLAPAFHDLDEQADAFSNVLIQAQDDRQGLHRAIGALCLEVRALQDRVKALEARCPLAQLPSRPFDPWMTNQWFFGPSTSYFEIVTNCLWLEYTNIILEVGSCALSSNVSDYFNSVPGDDPGPLGVSWEDGMPKGGSF